MVQKRSLSSLRRQDLPHFIHERFGRARRARATPLLDDLSTLPKSKKVEVVAFDKDKE